MRFASSAALALALLPSAFSQAAQNHSPGFPAVNNSNILHPAVPPSGALRPSAGPAARVNPRAVGAGRRYYGGGTLVVPYAPFVDPFYAGETGYDPSLGGYPLPQQPPQQPPPTIIINQNFQPETLHPQLRDYSNVQLPEPGVVITAPGEPPPPPPGNDAQQNLYLIAMKDGSVVTAQAYWVQGDTLNYVTLNGAQNHASLSLVDRDLSVRLNGERQVQFRLPAGRP